MPIINNTRYIASHYKWSCPKCKKEFQSKCERTTIFRQKLHFKNCIGKPVETQTNYEKTKKNIL